MAEDKPESVKCQHCGERVTPLRHDDTGLSCPECGVGIPYPEEEV